MYDDQPATASRTQATTPVRLGVGLGAVLVLLAAAAVADGSAPVARPSADPAPAAKPDPAHAPAQGAAGSSRPSPSHTETAVLPDLVGKPLHTARKAAEAAGFALLTSHDATGRGRVQIAEHRWKVCAQNPQPGTHPTVTQVEFATVERTETCPD